MMKIAAGSSTGAFHHEKEGRALAGGLERARLHMDAAILRRVE
jgi:hypothetical protein